jgi:hypothetical protein
LKVIYDILLIFLIFIDMRSHLNLSINEKEDLFDFLSLRFEYTSFLKWPSHHWKCQLHFFQIFKLLNIKIFTWKY